MFVATINNRSNTCLEYRGVVPTHLSRDIKSPFLRLYEISLRTKREKTVTEISVARFLVSTVIQDNDTQTDLCTSFPTARAGNYFPGREKTALPCVRELVTQNINN